MIERLVGELAAEAVRLAAEAEEAGPLHRACVAREARWARMNSDLAQIISMQSEASDVLIARIDRLEHQLSRTTGERIRRLIVGFWRR